MATAIVVPKEYETKQSALKAMCDSIVVSDAATCLQAKTAQRDIRTEMKLRHAVLDPFVIKAKTNYDEAKEEREKWIGPLETMDETLATKVKDYEREERRKAEEEQIRQNKLKVEAAEKQAAEEKKERERIAKEEKDKKIKEIKAAQKAGHIGAREAAKMLKEAGAFAEAAIEQAAADAEATVQAAKDNPVTVQPNIPKMAGVPSTINYKAEVKDANLLINSFVDACAKHNYERAQYLRQFIMVNEQQLNAEARKVKNPKRLESMIPGITATEN